MNALRLSTTTITERCAQYLVDNALTCETDDGVQLMMPVTAATLSELVDLVLREQPARRV